MGIFKLQSQAAKATWLSVIGVLSYGTFLIINMPADKLWHALPANNLPVQLYDITGTPWSGAAESVVIRNGSRQIVLPRVHWTMTMSDLIFGRIRLDLVLGNASSSIEGKGSVTLSSEMLKLENITIDTTPAWVIAATGGQVPGNVSGNLFVDLKEATLTKEGCLTLDGIAGLTGSQFSFILGRFDLGNTEAVLSCDNRELLAKLTQQSPLFSTNGEFRTGIHGRYTTVAQLTPGTALHPQIRQGLMFLATPNSQGTYNLNFSGRFL